MFGFRSPDVPQGPQFILGDFVLSPFTLEDVSAFCALTSNPAINAPMLTFPQPVPPRFARRRILQTHKWMAEGRGWSLALRYEGQMYGQFQILCMSQTRRIAEVAYWLKPEAQGKGIARAAMTRLIDEAIRNWPLKRLEATVNPGNEPSCRLLKALGFQFRAQELTPYDKPGRWRKQMADLLIFERHLTHVLHD